MYTLEIGIGCVGIAPKGTIIRHCVRIACLLVDAVEVSGKRERGKPIAFFPFPIVCKKRNIRSLKTIE